MCGICGALSLRGAPLDRATLEQMTATLLHRGPDDSGVWLRADEYGPACVPALGLGNTRLAIIDLSADGHQPMRDAAGRRWIVYNGEVYNFGALRDELIGRGIPFHSRTDTETILHLYAERGAACLELLRGMFALAIWDEADRTLFLARDRLGKKPLYYYRDDDWLIFGSEIKAILAHPAARAAKRMNADALPAYLTYGYVPTPDTLFENIHVLPPAHYLTARDGIISVTRYWDAPIAIGHQPPAMSNDEWAESLLAKLREAVKLRLVSDVPLGAFLSGGLDSSAIVALMGEAGAGRVKTFAIGFSDEPSFDERPHARRVADFLGCEHHEFVVRAQSVDLVPLLVRHHDQPFGDSSAIPTYLVAKCAREHVTVALTGDGGDELFAGYDRFRAARLAETYRRLPGVVRRAAEVVAAALPHGTGYRDAARNAARFFRSASQPLPARYLGWVGVMSPEVVAELCGSSFDPAAHFGEYFRMNGARDPLPALLDVNLRTYLPDDLLVKADRATMAASLEARSPFLDHELVELAARIPPDLKLKGGVGKYILKRALAGRLPPEIIHRRKHGFGVPIGRWFRQGLRDYLTETLLSERAMGRGILRGEAVRALVASHLSGERDYGHALWALLTLEVWQQMYF
ncbi:MAG: asparagine synthase (glutamine-hydrolyzing) [Chloroflexi bacterium]|nr:asparagine synthase (glutamine-hydrolyzing) [Chloroflexota bacterium]